MKPGQSYTMIKQLATALNAERNPPVKDGKAYRMLAFKVSASDLWVVAMIPMRFGSDPMTLLNTVNESYGEYVKLGSVSNGMLFFEHTNAAHLIDIVKHWYYGTDQPIPDSSGT